MGWRDDIAAAPSRPRLSDSHVEDGRVVESWRDLLEQARQRSGRPDLSLSVYALARVVASELGDGSPTEMACIADADVNRAEAAGKDVFAHATGGTNRFGRQGASGRPVATSLDPTPRHLRVAELVLHGPARGVARGARRYFDPVSQDALARKGKACPALVVLERWTYNKPWQDRAAGCALGAAQPHGQEEWVGAIDGVRPRRLMLMRPKTTAAVQAAAYEAARAELGAGRPSAGPVRGAGDVAVVLGLVVLGLGGL